MNVSELRIGNYILANGKVVSVGHIQDNFYGVLINGNGLDTGIYHPIFLTPEWLTKLGLISDVDGILWQLPESIQEKCKPDNGLKKSAFFFNNREDIQSYMDCQTRRTVKYVHDIQNLVFALTGEELEVSNAD